MITNTHLTFFSCRLRNGDKSILGASVPPSAQINRLAGNEFYGTGVSWQLAYLWVKVKLMIGIKFKARVRKYLRAAKDPLCIPIDGTQIRIRIETEM